MIDTHVHLDDKKYDGERENVIADLEKDGLDFVINNSCDAESMQNGFLLAQKYDRVFCTVGMHPYDAEAFDDDFADTMCLLAQHEKTVAVGEIGLDYHYEEANKRAQRDVFARQLELADRLQLPVTLHVRDAYGDAADVLEAQKKYLRHGVVWHCYSGSAEFARQMAKKGHYFAFGGVITFKNAKKEEVLAEVPFDRVLTETDCPYMTPVPFRAQKNYPKYVRFVLEKLAATYGKSVFETENRIAENVRRIFPKTDR